MSQYSIREIINAVLLVADTALVIVFVRFLLGEMQEKGWYVKLRNQAALALLIYFGGMTVVRIWAFILFQAYDSSEIWRVEVEVPIALAGTGIAVIGAVCCVRVFSPRGWGDWGWLVTLALSIGAATVAHLT